MRMQRDPHWIDGTPVPPGNGAWLQVFDPATGTVAGEVADGNQADVDAAVAAATRAFPGWSGLPAGERARWLERLADAIEAQLEAFADAEALDAGKPLALARDAEIPRAIANLRFYAHAATQFASEAHHGQAGRQRRGQVRIGGWAGAQGGRGLGEAFHLRGNARLRRKRWV